MNTDTVKLTMLSLDYSLISIEVFLARQRLTVGSVFQRYRFVEKQTLEVFLGKDVLKICSKFTGEHPCRSALSIKLQSNFIEIALWHGCSPVNLLHIFKILFAKNTSKWPLLFVGILQNSCSEKCCKTHRETFVVVSFF